MRRASTVALVIALPAAAFATVGWLRAAPAERAPSITIVGVRPLSTADPGLRDLITHTFAVRVAISGFRLLPNRPGALAAGDRARAGHWRLYLDGHELGDNLGDVTVTFTPYVAPGTHWIAAELSNADSTSLSPPVWSEPVVLHVPRVMRCWQTGWHGSPESGTPRFRCASARSTYRPSSQRSRTSPPTAALPRARPDPRVAAGTRSLLRGTHTRR